MQRFSLYIDHQLVSSLIRELQAIVQTCHQELDQQYPTHQLRAHIYEEFVFQVTTLYYAKYDLKLQHHEIKEEDLQKYYQLTAKLEGINADVKYEEVTGFEIVHKKGRPNKNQLAEDHLIHWVKSQISTQGKLNFTKKELDEIYLPLLQSNRPKAFPTNNYFRILKKHQLLEVTIANRNGVQKSVKQFSQHKSLSQEFAKKEEENYNFIDENGHELDESDLNSTSELQHQLLDQFDSSNEFKRSFKFRSRNNRRGSFLWKSKPRSCKMVNSKKELKAEKQRLKSMNMKNVFNEDADPEAIDHQWDEMSMSDELFVKAGPHPEIYDNSKSFE